MSKYLLALIIIIYSGLVTASAPHAEQSLNQLYSDIKQERALQKKADKEREALFKKHKSDQEIQLNKLRKELSQKQAELKILKDQVAKAKQRITDNKQQIASRSHNLKDLFSVWRQAVKDSKSNMQTSNTSHQYPEKLEQITQLSIQSSLPDSQDLKSIFELFQHDIHQGKQSISYQGNVIDEAGQSSLQPIQRIGVFSATSEGKFLLHDPAKNTLISLPVQPENAVRSIIEDSSYKNLQSGASIEVVIDPSHGLVLEQLALVPTWEDRFHQGGYIGYVIVSLGCLGLLLSLIRWLMITHMQFAINRQMKSPSNIDTRNPLGRIIAAYQESVKHKQSDRRKSEKVDTETLEVQLQEIVMSEMPKLDKGLGTIKLLAAVAPLLGLLGTVVGMINTFQSITLVGNADPKLMAGGISQALMTTVMGLLAAVPLLFSHNLLASKTKKIITFLTQQSLGFIVKYMQEQDTRITKSPIASASQTPEQDK